jgi:type-F conjugative transfer system pilin assembly protein TrbC
MKPTATVFRYAPGLVNNDMKATTDAVMGLVKAGITEGVQIDPTLYSQYNIRSVPALVVRCAKPVSTSYKAISA